jgi:hypothetical protein
VEALIVQKKRKWVERDQGREECNEGARGAKRKVVCIKWWKYRGKAKGGQRRDVLVRGSMSKGTGR